MTSALDNLTRTAGTPATPATPSTSGGQTLDRQAFLKLLIAQVRQQDPLKPMEGTEFVTQLAQFSVVEQAIEQSRQLDVVGAQIRGLVSEVDVLRNLVSGEAHLEGTIDGILDNDYATVSPDTRVELLQGVLADAKVALVTVGLSLVGIISKIDVIDYHPRRATDLKVP
jgi:flagellar hook assembly protein FlgD